MQLSQWCESIFPSKWDWGELILLWGGRRIYGVFFLSVMDGLVCKLLLWFEQGLPQEVGMLEQLWQSTMMIYILILILRTKTKQHRWPRRKRRNDTGFQRMMNYYMILKKITEIRPGSMHGEEATMGWEDRGHVSNSLFRVVMLSWIALPAWPRCVLIAKGMNHTKLNIEQCL